MSSRSNQVELPGDEADSDDEREDVYPAISSDGSAIIIRDNERWLESGGGLQETDIMILLTPVVVPIDQDPNPSDPFEILGRILANRRGRVRQIPYSRRIGLNSTHLGFIQRGNLIILCLVPLDGLLNPTPAEIAFAVRESSPFVLVLCCSAAEARTIPNFPTVIRTDDYSRPALEAIANLLLDTQSHSPGRSFISSTSCSQLEPEPSQISATAASASVAPRLWSVEEWNEARDISEVWGLWAQAFKAPFEISKETLSALLRRPGYAKHYVVRQSNEEVLGFCATYLSYVDKAGDSLVGSLAILVVHPLYKNQGIGLSLHNHSVTALKRTRGTIRLQLGSTFPRIFYGPPIDTTHEEWFRRRGWRLDRRDAPGNGYIVYDLLLDVSDWRLPVLLPQSQVVFRNCTQEDMQDILQIVERTSRICWFDQYSCLMNGPNVKDVVLATIDGKIIAIALTYTPSCGSQVAANLPWASQIGQDVGGITCVCISPNNQEGIELRLLNACVKMLQGQGMRRVFLDGVTEGVEHLMAMGFREWAVYKDVWKDVS